MAKLQKLRETNRQKWINGFVPEGKAGAASSNTKLQLDATTVALFDNAEVSGWLAPLAANHPGRLQGFHRLIERGLHRR